jgi:hypothetical protein
MSTRNEPSPAYVGDRPIRRKILKWTKEVLIVLGLFQIVTYDLLGHATMPAVMVYYLPQDTHWRGREFAYAAINSKTWDRMWWHQRLATYLLLRTRFSQVYGGEEQIPETDWTPRKPRSLKTGCILSWKLGGWAPLWHRAHIGDWEGPRAGSGRTTHFVWILGLWVPVYTEGVGIS